jgi:anthranilate phosphoribosyltransferase
MSAMQASPATGTEFKSVIARVASGTPLSFAEAAAAFDQLLEGIATPAQIAAFLIALRMRGETADEISGAVSAMRGKMVRVEAPPGAIDIVGTGGDNSGSYNVSTLAAIIAASCGVVVAKHGNVAASSLSGSADILSALGVKIGLSATGVSSCLTEAGIAFMLAKSHHPAMRHVGPVRSELGTRTIFNLLGPQCNPAGVKRLLVGVFDRRWMQPVAETLGKLGAEHVMVVHGADGLDEISTTGATELVEWTKKGTRTGIITPEEAGLPRASIADLKGGDAAYNAAALRRVLGGERSAYRDIAVLNAAGGLLVAGKVPDLRSGVETAAAALDSGAAAKTLDRLVASSQKAA